ncbi:MAG: DUF420 domain-containing protein [Candidatus Cyclobacteriaceae bacterium M3_2C_046]
MARAISDKRYYYLITIVSIVIPLVVALLIFNPAKISFQGDWIYLLPHLNGTLNTVTSVLLLSGFYFIRKGDQEKHKTMMTFGFLLGTIFLVSYVIYHSSAPSTKFGDLDGDGMLSATESAELGSMRIIYLAILLSHILLAIVVVPFVLLAMFHALRKDFKRHKKIVKYAFPIWLYVSVTGVLVYLMIRPYY